MSKLLKRTHNCGELSAKNKGQEVILCGWVDRRRDHGGLIFVDLRDREGITQIVFNPEVNKEVHAEAESIRNEYVLAIVGRVSPRPEGTVNAHLKTGEIEIVVSKLEILNRAAPLPFAINDNEEISESLRLKYRYLDLRRSDMRERLITRSKVVKTVRDFLDSEGVIEVETPYLTKSTPEGARDYLVPSRLNQGHFYALPQSPQLFKQILMIAGYEKYYQIAKCFRDEDLRADRQPEFTQIDMEFSFVDRSDIMSLIEGMMSQVFEKVMGLKIETPFTVIPYHEAMDRYGCDKPDLRFGMELKDIADVAAESEFKVFADTIKNGGEVRGINAKGCSGYSRKDVDLLMEEAKIFGSKGLAWLKITDTGIESPIAKFFIPEQLEKIRGRLEGEAGDLLLFVADNRKVVLDSLAHLRNLFGQRLGMIDEKKYAFAWVTDFPLLEWHEEEKRWFAMHHPFTSPVDEDIPLFDADPGKMRTHAYDLVLNGSEIGGGSIRIHKKEIQEKMFRVLGIGEEEAREKFGFFIDALDYGTPPHGGIAIGLDRFIAMLTGAKSIRDVIAFPKTQKGVCLMTEAPSAVDKKQLKELGIKIDSK